MKQGRQVRKELSESKDNKRKVSDHDRCPVIVDTTAALLAEDQCCYVLAVELHLPECCRNRADV